MHERKPLTNDEGEVRELLLADIKRFRPIADALPPESLEKLGVRAAGETVLPRVTASLASRVQHPSGNRTVMDWFDRLESVLEAEAQLSGLFDHAATVGQVREFLVGRVLKSILPASSHIGRGKVIDHRGQTSKQIDIIIYDPRFPKMETGGSGLYFVEGVLATIEVKSWIISKELDLSLENSKSVLTLSPYGEHPEEAEERIKFYMQQGNLSHGEAEHRFWYMYRPATYVFGFNSNLTFDATCDRIRGWWERAGVPFSAYFPLLPRVVVSGHIVGVTNDGRITLDAADGASHVMSLFETKRRFRWFALHLMDSVSNRLGLRNFAEKFDYRISDYYPWSDYLKGLEGSNVKMLDWHSEAEK